MKTISSPKWWKTRSCAEEHGHYKSAPSLAEPPLHQEADILGVRHPHCLRTVPTGDIPTSDMQLLGRQFKREFARVQDKPSMADALIICASIVELYTSLTFKTDKLVAIAGLASAISPAVGGQ